MEEMQVIQTTMARGTRAVQGREDGEDKAAKGNGRG